MPQNRIIQDGGCLGRDPLPCEGVGGPQGEPAELTAPWDKGRSWKDRGAPRWGLWRRTASLQGRPSPPTLPLSSSGDTLLAKCPENQEAEVHSCQTVERWRVKKVWKVMEGRMGEAQSGPMWKMQPPA